MGIRASKKEAFQVKATYEQAYALALKSIHEAGFKRIKEASQIGQLTGEVRGATLWGNLTVTIRRSEIPAVCDVELVSIANVDNFYALFRSPNRIILNRFKDAMDKSLTI